MAAAGLKSRSRIRHCSASILRFQAVSPGRVDSAMSTLVNDVEGLMPLNVSQFALPSQVAVPTGSQGASPMHPVLQSPRCRCWRSHRGDRSDCFGCGNERAGTCSTISSRQLLAAYRSTAICARLPWTYQHRPTTISNGGFGGSGWYQYDQSCISALILWWLGVDTCCRVGRLCRLGTGATDRWCCADGPHGRRVKGWWRP